MKYEITATVKWKGRRGNKPNVINLEVPFEEMSFLNLGKHIPPLKQYGDFLGDSDREEIRQWVGQHLAKSYGKPSSFSLLFRNDFQRW